MRYRHVFTLWIAGVTAVACTSASGAPAPTAEVIVKRCLASYDAAKSFQGEVKFVKGSGHERSWISMRVKAENDAQGMIARSALSMSGGEDGKPGTEIEIMQVIDDGTTVFIIHPEMKQYAASPHAPDRVSGLFLRSLTNVQVIAHRFSVNVQPVDGRPTFILSSKLADGTAEVRIDRATYRLLSIHMERGKTPVRDLSDVMVSSQVFDQPIPAETFVWKPPAGFTQTPADGAQQPPPAVPPRP